MKPTVLHPKFTTRVWAGRITEWNQKTGLGYVRCEPPAQRDLLETYESELRTKQFFFTRKQILRSSLPVSLTAGQSVEVTVTLVNSLVQVSSIKPQTATNGIETAKEGERPLLTDGSDTVGETDERHVEDSHHKQQDASITKRALPTRSTLLPTWRSPKKRFWTSGT